MAAYGTITSVYEDLRAKIMSGDLFPSSSLTETDLATQYRVSRNTVKKALLMLEGENLVLIEPNKGAKVRSYSLTEVLEHLEVRGLLEGFIVRLAVPNISSKQIESLEEILKEMHICNDQRRLVDYSECNLRFHGIVCDACPNRTLVDISTGLHIQMSKYNTKTTLIPGRAEESMVEHEAIFAAVKAKDAVLAEEMVRKHIENVRKVFAENYRLLF